MDLNAPDMPIAEISDVGRHLHDAFLSPDGRYVVVSSYEDNIVTVIDLAEKRMQAAPRLRCHGPVAWSVARHRDQHRRKPL